MAEMDGHSIEAEFALSAFNRVTHGRAQLSDWFASLLSGMRIPWDMDSPSVIHGWQQHSIPSLADFKLALFLVVVLPAVRLVLECTIFEVSGGSIRRSF